MDQCLGNPHGRRCLEADEEEAPELIAKTVREVSHADTAIIVLQSVVTWAAEITDGKNASALLGLTFPTRGPRR